MVRGTAISFVVSMLLTTVATWLMLTETVHAQQAPRHVFSGLVQNLGDPVYQGQVSFLDMSGQEVATGNISGGRYKIGVVEPAGRNYSGQGFHITVTFQNRIYEWQKRTAWQAGGVTVLDLDVEGWKWHAASSPDRQQEDQRRMDQNNQDRARMLAEDQRRMDQNDQDRDRRMEMDEQRMEMEEAMRREQMDMERERMEREADMREKEGEQRRDMEEDMRRDQMEMERERMKRDDEMREKEGEKRMEKERERMEREEEMRREQMEMERERIERGQPGVQPVAGERPKGGPSRGLFSNRKAGEATSGIDNIMDPGTLTIIGIVLTVLTTGMTLLKGD